MDMITPVVSYVKGAVDWERKHTLLDLEYEWRRLR
jgi:hypothetical protein